MAKIIITGGTGFIGSNLAEFLLNCKHQITLIDNLSNSSIKNIYGINNKVNFHNIDVKNINRLNLKADFFIHLAAKAEILISKRKEHKYFNENISNLQACLNFCAQKNIKNFIFASSASIYGDTKNKKVNENLKNNPEHYYGFTKSVGEKLVSEYSRINKLNFVNLRFFNIYGYKSQAVIGKFIHHKLNNLPLTIYGNGLQERDFLHVDDLSNLINQIIYKGCCNSSLNAGSGKSISILKIAKMLSKNLVFLDKRSDDIEKSISQIEKAYKFYNWKPKISLSIKTIEEISRNKKFYKNISYPSLDQQKKIIKKFNEKL